MIQIATEKLTIAENDGTPSTLDVGLLEQQLGEAFRHLGYNDIWMAEDISLTIKEKIHESDATLVTRQQIDTMVHTILTALGYTDVAMAYAHSTGSTDVAPMLTGMQSWTRESITGVLSSSLPMTRSQLTKVSELCSQAIRILKLHQATPRLILELATHIVANENLQEETAARSPGNAYWELNGVTPNTMELVTCGLLHPLPPSQFLPKARLGLNFPQLIRLYPDWWMPFSLTISLKKLAPCMAELLNSMRKELEEKHPLLADSPSHLILQGCLDTLNNEPNLWKKKNRESMRQLLETSLKEEISPLVSYAIDISIK